MRLRLLPIAAVTLVVALLGLASVAAAQNFQPGDVVVPGFVPGPYGYLGGMWRIRDKIATPFYGSNLFSAPTDFMIDDQGRFVFIATPLSTNGSDHALFRMNPADGTLERLFMMPYISSGDSLPEGITGGSFYIWKQTLHLEKTLTLSVVDTVNGGWPTVKLVDSYVCAPGIAGPTGAGSHVIRYTPSTGRLQEAYSIAPIRLDAPIAMTGSNAEIWYGGFEQFARALPEVQANLHFHVGNTVVNAEVTGRPDVKLVYGNEVLDNTAIANVTAECNHIQDDNVPLVNGAFNVFDADGLGMIDGSLYATSDEVSTGTPYMFNIAPRGLTLNPTSCQFIPVVAANGPVPWNDPNDGHATSAPWSSGDTGGVLANANGWVQFVGTDGQVTLLTTPSSLFTGRPVRIPNSSSAAAQLSTSLQTTAADTAAAMLVFRVDSLANLLVVDSNGARVGFDSTGAVIDDSGGTATTVAVGGGWPKFILLSKPNTGPFQVRVTSATGGPYGVRAYYGHASLAGVEADATGTLPAGGGFTHGLVVTPPQTLQWLAGNTGVSDGPVSSGLGIDWIGPQPAMKWVSFACRIPAAGRVKLELFDVSGRRVATLINETRTEGTFTKSWALRSDDGRQLAAGVYLARLSMPGAAAVRHVVVTR